MMFTLDKDIDLSYRDDFVCPFNERIPYGAWRFLGERLLDRYPLYRMEILAPASFTNYKTAVRNGADAIYFGYGELNARASAANNGKLEDIVSYCHIFGIRAYLTLNVMIKDAEIKKVKEVIIEAEKAKIDAFIISDLALVPIIRQNSNAQIHASTQMGIHNRAGAEYAAKIGIDRIILSREVTLADIKDIRDNVRIETEVFVHGALCVAFSGACLLSSMLTGKSGNRGRCAQLCRREYTCYIDGRRVNNGYLLSPKDICMASEIETLKSVRVTSAKIEGRLRNDEYVKGVPYIYSQIRNGIPYSRETEDNLKIYFNRGNFTKGYFENNDIIYKERPNHIGLYCGKIVNRLSKNLFLVYSDRKLQKGDFLRALRHDREIGGLEATGEVKIYNGKEHYVVFARCEAMIGDTVYLTKSNLEIDEPLTRVTQLAIGVFGGKPIHIIATSDDFVWEYYSEEPVPIVSDEEKTDERYLSRKLTRDRSSGIELYCPQVVVENAHLTDEQIESLRVMIINEVKKNIITDYRRPAKKPLKKFVQKEKIAGDFIELDSVRQINSYVIKKFDNIVFSPRKYDIEACKAFYSKAKSENKNIFIKFPIFIPAAQLKLTENIIGIFDGVVANNLGVYHIAEKMNKLTVAGWALNVSNTKNPLLKTSNQTIISTELNSKEIEKFADCLIYSFGRLPLMYLNHCPKKLSGINCASCSKFREVTYKDNKGEYPIITKKLGNYCQHEMKNSFVTNLGAAATKNNFRYFDFCDFKSEDIKKILETYFYGKEIITPKEFNHLHLSRGVE